MIITLDIRGRIPSKKNSKRWTGKYLISSKEYLDWENDQLKQIKWDKKPIKKVKEIIYKLTLPDNRRTDFSNKIESINDLLVKKGVLEDDNVNVIGNSRNVYMGVDKENAGMFLILDVDER